MLCFSLVMLVFALSAYVRGPAFSVLSPFWFPASWLAGELSWLFGIIQIVVVVSFVFVTDHINYVELAGVVISVATIYLWLRLHRKNFLAGHIFQSALQKGLGENYESELRSDVSITSPSVIKKRDWLKPFSFKRSGVEKIKNISYGYLPRHQLDIYRPSQNSHQNTFTSHNRPVLLHIHGGAWAVGHKRQQGQPLMQYLAQNGWICIDINYRLAPKHRMPDCVVDVKMCIVWLKENIAQYGGDPEFIAITGGSAGGHLCALAALTPNHPEFQPGFEEKDTRVQAAVPVYGVYDFTHHDRDGRTVRYFLEKYVMPKIHGPNTLFWKNMSPLFRIDDAAPPIFITHGSKDCVVPVEQAHDFVKALRERNNAPVVYAELTGAQHGYEVFHSVRTEYHIEAVGKFLHYCYGKAKQ